MGTVTRLRTPARVSPLRPRRQPQRDRALDARLVPGSVVEHPDGLHGPGCLAVLVRRDAPDALGRVQRGVHDWWVMSCGEQPEVVGTIASFPTLDGARMERYDRDLLVAVLLADALVWVLRSWTHPGRWTPSAIRRTALAGLAEQDGAS